MAHGDPALDPALPGPGARRDPRNLRGDRPPASARKDYGGPDKVLAGRAWSRLSERGVFPDLEALALHRPRHHAAQAPPAASTPASSPSTATAIAGEVEGMVGPESELVELVWVTIAQAKTLDLPPITTVISGRSWRPGPRRVSATSSRSRSSTISVAVSCGSCCRYSATCHPRALAKRDP